MDNDPKNEYNTYNGKGASTHLEQISNEEP